MTDEQMTDEQMTEPMADAPAPEQEAVVAEQAAPEAEQAPPEANAPVAEAPEVAVEAEPAPVKAEKAPKADKQAAPKKARAEAPVADAPVAAADERVAAASEAPAKAPAGPRGVRLKYTAEVVPALKRQFEYANPNQVPRLEKIVVNVGLGEALSNAKAIDAASHDLTAITGQKPIVTRARRSIAQFRVRTGNPIGLKVTLRGQRMWDFLERLTLLTLPRIRDFRGIPSKSFDGRGNYTLGMREQIAFPEIDYDKVDRLRGLEVSIVTTAKSDEESKRLLELLGMPFAS
jgi:large subunit ribosomal protein L5